MTGLAEWLLAQYDADERKAHATAEDYLPPWRGREVDEEGYSMESDIVFTADDRRVVYWETGSRETADRLAAYIVLHDPAAVLADLAAKRRIVARHIPARVGPRAGIDCFMDGDLYPCEDLRLLALPYAGREGYDPAWSPDA